MESIIPIVFEMAASERTIHPSITTMFPFRRGLRGRKRAVRLRPASVWIGLELTIAPPAGDPPGLVQHPADQDAGGEYKDRKYEADHTVDLPTLGHGCATLKWYFGVP